MKYSFIAFDTFDKSIIWPCKLYTTAKYALLLIILYNSRCHIRNPVGIFDKLGGLQWELPVLEGIWIVVCEYEGKLDKTETRWILGLATAGIVSPDAIARQGVVIYKLIGARDDSVRSDVHIHLRRVRENSRPEGQARDFVLHKSGRENHENQVIHRPWIRHVWGYHRGVRQR